MEVVIISEKSTYEELEERIKELESKVTRETFFNNLINAIPTPVFYKDRSGRYVGFNDAFELFFGTTRENLIGKSVFDINPKHLAEKYYARDNELFESGEKQQYESQVKNSNGELRDVIFNKSVYTDQDHSVVGLIGTVLDITELKQVEIEKNELIVSLQEALSKVKQLSALLPICSFCKQIRDDEGYWTQIESYIYKHSGTNFSHSICPVCAKKHYPDIDIYTEDGKISDIEGGGQ